MFDDPLDPVVRQALIDRYEGFELVELLEISIEDIIDAHMERILENEGQLRDELGLAPLEDDEDGADQS